MIPAYIVKITTPKGVVLDGLWFGPKRPKKALIWIHGLGSSVFGKQELFKELSRQHIGVLAFNNRGHDLASKINFHRSGRGVALGGRAHEIFTDCVDDIEGAIDFVKERGVRDIYLAGHSTGCQKSIYWADKKGKRVKGIILLAPISDYSAIRLEYPERKVRTALGTAKELIKKKRGDEFLPMKVWPLHEDAQRIVSLYSGDSAEELFPYWNPKRQPRALRSIRIPLLVLLAERDEHADRTAKNLARWFQDHCKRADSVVVIPRVTHSFKRGEKTVAKAVRAFMKER